MPFKDPEKRLQYHRQYNMRWNLAHVGFRRKYNWRMRGLDPGKAEWTYQSTNKCSICNSTVMGSNKHIDHNHGSKVPRGVLCKRCNLAIGLFREDRRIMEGAVSYLETH
jgi:hypothetical protein